MPLRYLRALMLCSMGMFDAASVFYLGGMKGRAAMWAHLGGALAAVSVALITGVSIRRRHWEWMLSCFGLLVYAILVVVVIAYDEKSAGLLAAALLPILIVWAMYDLRPMPGSIRSVPGAAEPDSP